MTAPLLTCVRCTVSPTGLSDASHAEARTTVQHCLSAHISVPVHALVASCTVLLSYYESLQKRKDVKIRTHLVDADLVPGKAAMLF